MTKKHCFGALSVLLLLIAALTSACNSDEGGTYEVNTVSYASTAVTGFSLGNSSKVLNNLDSVYFSIDLVNARIFNATPLPYKTNISALLVNITTDDCSVVELNFTTKWGNDTTLDYSNSANDSVNFANGPVVLHVVSYDSQAQRNYTVTVNVYEEDPDSLIWTRQSDVLPGNIGDAEAVKTVLAANRYYTLASTGSGYKMSTSQQLYYFDDWTEATDVDFSSFTPQVDSFTGSSDGTLYILGTDNILYMSADGGSSWTTTGTAMNYIYGAYQNSVLGNVSDNGSLTGTRYPAGDTFSLPADFPVNSTSDMVTNSTSWEVNPLAVLCGGVTADGTYSGDTWGFDGTRWAKINSGSLEAAAGRSIFKYIIAETDTMSWRVTERPVIFNMGGRNAAGEMLSTVYYSTDMGVHWIEAPSNMQLPDDFPLMAGARIFVEDDELSIEARAIKPITQWECPYIYMYGGRDAAGAPGTAVWQGVLNRYTMVPLE